MRHTIQLNLRKKWMKYIYKFWTWSLNNHIWQESRMSYHIILERSTSDQNWQQNKTNNINLKYWNDVPIKIIKLFFSQLLFTMLLCTSLIILSKLKDLYFESNHIGHYSLLLKNTLPLGITFYCQRESSN